MPPPRSSTPSRGSRQRSTSPPRFRSISTGRLDQTSSAASPARGPRVGRATIPALFVVALGLRLWGINFGLPALYRPDEDVTVGRAMGILHGIVDPHFADWPHLYFYLAAAWLAPFHLLGLVSDQASAYLGVRVLDAILGSLTVLVVFEFGRHAYGWLGGFLAAAALTVAFLHVRDSHFAMLDIPLALALTVGLYVAYRTTTMSGARPLLLNGVSLGIATSLKYNGAFVFAGIAAAQTLRGRAARSAWLPPVARLVLVAVVGVGTLAVTSPFLVLDPAVSGHGLRYIFQHLATTSAPAIGYVELAIGLWFGIDPVLVLIGTIGVGYAVFRRQPADWIALA